MWHVVPQRSGRARLLSSRKGSKGLEREYVYLYEFLLLHGSYGLAAFDLQNDRGHAENDSMKFAEEQLNLQNDMRHAENDDPNIHVLQLNR